GVLTAFALFAAFSGLWAADAEQSLQSFGRTMLYAGVVLLACSACTRQSAARWRDGIAPSLVAGCAPALGSRPFPGVVSNGPLLGFLPQAPTRLSYPVDYWNGLAILVALACPPLLSVAVSGRREAVRALALAPFPALAATVYLASSRSGAATIIIGI